MKAMEETYVGDGVYAYFDGWQVRLRVPRGKEDHIVFLKPHVWRGLVVFVAGVNSIWSTLGGEEGSGSNRQVLKNRKGPL